MKSLIKVLVLICLVCFLPLSSIGDDYVIAPAIPDKYLKSDGSITTWSGTVILGPDAGRATTYIRSPYQIAKWLLPNGSIASALPFSGGGGGVETDTNCDQSQYYEIGVLCQDSDNAKLYKGIGTAIEEIASGASGDISQSGSPANHYWAYFTADKTITGVAITASKPVCSDANGDPAVCAGTEGVWQPVNASLTALSGLSSPITVDGNNITVPGALITTAANGDRQIGTLDNTTTLTFLTAGTYGWYFSNGLPYFNVNGTGYKSMYEGGGFGGLIFGDASPDAAGEIGYDGELKYYDAVGSKTVATVGGALGTPSFTALNMPSSTNDVGATTGQIAHDSNDTASNSGGALEWYDGAQVRSIVDTGTNYTIITKTEYLPIRYAEDGTTAPDAAAAVTGKKIIARNFAEGEDVVFFWAVPNDYVGGGEIKYRIHYALSTDGEANDTATFSMTGCAITNSGDIACSAGTALTVSDEIGTDDDQYQYMVSDYSAASNTDWGVTANGMAKLAFSYATAGDYTHDVLVIGIEIKYKAKIIGFDGY